MNGFIVAGAVLVASAVIGMGLGVLAAQLTPGELFEVDITSDDIGEGE
jgi:hypothetical protein